MPKFKTQEMPDHLKCKYLQDSEAGISIPFECRKCSRRRILTLMQDCLCMPWAWSRLWGFNLILYTLPRLCLILHEHILFTVPSCKILFGNRRFVHADMKSGVLMRGPWQKCLMILSACRIFAWPLTMSGACPHSGNCSSNRVKFTCSPYTAGYLRHLQKPTMLSSGGW